MSGAELALQLDEHVASAAASLAGGLPQAAPWTELYGLLIAANRREDAARLEQAFAAKPAQQEQLTPTQAELLAQMYCRQKNAASHSDAVLFRTSLINFYTANEQNWQPPKELPAWTIDERWPVNWTAQIAALAPQSAALMQSEPASKSTFMRLLAELDLAFHGLDSQPPTLPEREIVAQWLSNWPLAQPTASGTERCTAALAVELRADVRALISELEHAELSEGEIQSAAVTHLCEALIVILPLATAQLSGLSFALPSLLNYLENSGSWALSIQQEWIEMLVELESLLCAAATTGNRAVNALQAQRQTAQRELAEQIGVSIIGVERLLDHHQLQAIDNALLVQLKLQCEQIAALLVVLDEPDFSLAVAHIARQLDQRSRELDQRIRTAELTTIADLLAALEVVLARRYRSQPLSIAAFSPAVQMDLIDVAKTVVLHDWRGGEYG